MGLVKSMAKEMMREIGNKSREFYEFVLPPVDMIIDDKKLTVVIDMPGFDKKTSSCQSLEIFFQLMLKKILAIRKTII